MHIKYAISIVSALHIGFRWSLRLPGCLLAPVDKIVREVVRMGYDGIQAIPVWGLVINEILVPFILLSQGPWNAVKSLWEVLLHKLGTLGVPSKLRDWVVSPPPNVCLKMVVAMIRAGIRRVYHDFNEGQLVELHPGLDMSAKEVCERCLENNTRLVLDLHHLRRAYREEELSDTRDPAKHAYRQSHSPSPLWEEKTDKEQQLSEWQRVIRLLAPFIDVIHVQPGDGETPEDFVSDPLGSITGQLLLYALEQIKLIDPTREIILVAEYNPGIKCLLVSMLSRKLAKEYLAAMKTIVKAVA